MNELNEYQQFKKFLSGFLIRKLENKLNADDFDEEKYEYIRPYLETLLPSLSLTEMFRVQAYFNDLLAFHLKGILGNSVIPSPPSSPIPAFDGQVSTSNALGTQSQTFEISGLSSQANVQEQTPIEREAQMPRRTAPLMQSTPLSVPMHFGEETGTLVDQQLWGRANENDFIAEVISQINLSSIPQVSARHPVPTTTENSEAQVGTSSAQDIEPTAVPVQTAVRRRRIGETNSPQETRRRPLFIEPPRQPKKRLKKMPFDTICSLAYKQRTEDKTKKANESFLYFHQMPGKIRFMIKRIIDNVVIPEGKRGHIQKQRINNLSNIIRAYASQRQSSVEQPNEISLPTMLPQAILRSSQLQPFMPLRADTSSPLQSIEIDRIASIPMRSILRQQPLLTIPEGDSSIQIPLTPPPDEIQINNSSICVPPLDEHLSGIPSDIALVSIPPIATPECFEMIVERSKIINPTEQENISTVPMHTGISSGAVPEDIEMTDGQPTTSNAVIPIDDPVHLELDPRVEIIQSRVVPQVADNEANENCNWFEVLRPRGDIAYPREGGERRKHRKRKRARVREEDDRNVRPRQAYELPEIPISPQHNDFLNIPADFAEQITQEPIINHEVESEFNSYFDLLKEANPDCWRCERFNPFLISESDDFEMHTYLFKRMIKDDYVPMDTLHEQGTSRLEAAKGFRLILELKTMGLIEIDAIDTRIMGFKFKADND